MKDNQEYNVFGEKDLQEHDVADMRKVRKYRTYIQSVIDGDVLCYVPTFTPQLKAIDSRINLLSKRLDSIQLYLMDRFDRDMADQEDAVRSELKMLFADRERTRNMSAIIDRKGSDHNLRRLHTSAQYLFKWGYIESYSINKGMISGVWFDKYDQPQRSIFNTVEYPESINENPITPINDYITHTMDIRERDRMQDHTPEVEQETFEGDMKWDNFKASRVRPPAHQSTSNVILTKIRIARRAPLFRETFKQWKK